MLFKGTKVIIPTIFDQKCSGEFTKVTMGQRNLKNGHEQSCTGRTSLGSQTFLQAPKLRTYVQTQSRRGKGKSGREERNVWARFYRMPVRK